ncbi:uncharacterized protein LOC131664063 [Phymastichus coffea]|uniref:uncharacterized protein LOC131664063 n=1 Tax=Phymastichus coffea TaxID=108790 RepID=UPI00273B9213|nr:uncharacterized protein LOC131664063 [Phymastichus coffea]
MAENGLYSLLLRIGYEEYTSLFEAKDITVDTLKSISFTDAKNILPSDELDKFWTRHQDYFSNRVLEPRTNNQHLNETNSTLDKTISIIRTSIPNLPLQEVNENERVNRLFVTENIDIHKILDQTFEGKHVLKWYYHNRSLNVTKRKKLVHLVMCAVLRLCNRKLEEPDFMILRRKIVEVFPNELATIYCTFCCKKNAINNKGQKALGKILNKYINLRRLPIGIYQPEASVQQNYENSDEDEPSDYVQHSLNWLRNFEEPWDDAKEHWSNTYKYRHPTNEEAPKKRVNSTFDIYSILKTPKGYELWEIDFKLSGICPIDNAIENFSDFVSKISQYRPLPNDDISVILKEGLEKENLKQDSRTFIQLLQLSLMFTPTARISQGKRKYWKPSCLESFEGISPTLRVMVIFRELKKIGVFLLPVKISLCSLT